MALILFESRVNLVTAATPSFGGFVVGYDTLGVLKQKDHLGVITSIGSAGGGTLAQTLSLGKTTGTNSIYLDIASGIKSSGGSASLMLDSGISGNYLKLSTSNSGSNLTMTDTTTQISIATSSNINLDSTSISLNVGLNQFLLQNNNSYLKLGTTNVLEFTTSTTVRGTGNRVPAFISSNASRFSNAVTNSVIIGGSNIVGTQSDSVYAPNLIIKDGGYVKGISGDGKLRFNSDNETYLTSTEKIIGMLNSKNRIISDYSGIFITDIDSEFNTRRENANITFISSSNATVDRGLSNTVVIGGQDLRVNSRDTVYLGGIVDINNKYKLPTVDGTSGQFIKTDGVGNLTWAAASVDLTSTALVTPTITSRWNISKSGGTTSFGPIVINGTGTSIGTFSVGTFSTSIIVTVPVGCVVRYTGTCSIPAATTGYSTPTTITGSYSFGSGTYPRVSTTLSTTISSSTNTTYTTVITKPKTGLIVSGSQVISPTGLFDTTSVSTSVFFSNIFYFGYLNIGAPSVSLTQADVDTVGFITNLQVEGLGNYRFGNKSQKFAANDGNAGSRLVFAYPSSLGDLSSLTVTAYPEPIPAPVVSSTLNAFIKRTSVLSITTISGAVIDYMVYVAVADNSYGNDGTTVTITTL